MKSSYFNGARGTASARIAGIALALAGALAIGSCGEDTVTSPGPPLPPAGTTDDLIALTRRALPQHFLYPLQLTTASTFAEVTPSIAISADIQLKDAASAGFRGTLGFIAAGIVSARGTGGGYYELYQNGLTVNGVPQYLYSSMFPEENGIALTFDALAYHYFRATGSSVFPAFEDSIRSVRELSLTWPPNNAILSRNDDALVSWNIYPDTTLIMAAVYATNDTSIHFAQIYAQEPDGSLLIPKALLQAVPHTGEVGQAIITVARFRQVDHMVGDRPLRLLSESAKVRTVTLVDSIPGGGANRGPQLANARRR